MHKNLPVIPLCSHDHSGMPEKHTAECNRPGKAPLVKWRGRGTPAEEEIAGWVADFPDANIGMLLGSASGYVGVDVDGEGGERLLADWSKGDLPDTWEFATGLGRRLLYKVPDSMILRIRSQSAGNGGHQECTLLGEGSQTVMPPSVHPSGTVYQWKDGCSPWERECETAPMWLVRMMSDPTTSGQSGSGEDPDAIEKLAEGCEKFAEGWQVQQNAGLSNDDWFLWSSLLVRAGQTKAAMTFSGASAKHDVQSEERIRKLETNEKAGPARCMTFGCGEEQIKACHGIVLRNAKGDAVNSPAGLLKPNPVAEALLLAQKAVELADSGDPGAPMEPHALQAFLRLKTRSPAEYARLEQRLRVAKLSMRNFQQALKRAGEHTAQTQMSDETLTEKGFHIENGRVSGMNQNKYARYVLTQLDLGVAEGERFYLYEGGVWVQMGDLVVKRKLRDFLHDLVPDFWTEKMEERYVGALLREAEYLDELDGQRDYINLQNGMLSLKNFELLPHNPGYHSSIQIRIPYTPDAGCPRFLQFLNEVFLGDQELIRVVQEMFGYCLTAETRAEKAFVLHGEGSNGKSVLLSVLKALCGKENTSSVPLAELENPFARHEIVGKTLNLAAENEIEANKGLNTQYFKAIVSGDPIYIDVKHGRGFMYEAICKLVFATNKLPYSRDKSHAFPRRLVILPFRARFTSETADKHLREKLEGELPGVLNFALEGLKRLREQNYVFSRSRVAEQALAEYRANINPMLSFISDCVEPTPGTGGLTRKRLREEFIRWCRENGHSGLAEMTFKNFWEAFRKALDEERIEYEDTKSNGVDGFKGITIKNKRGNNSDPSADLRQMFKDDSKG
ncbi:phage/plasmid primase, P4 family [Paenibacillus validus]|uniref:phage/plasmid primase, P4 family n=1 Tax=Paenibacillus validus TaxID=44253 RepID=UPI003D27FD36